MREAIEEGEKGWGWVLKDAKRGEDGWKERESPNIISKLQADWIISESIIH